MTWVEAKRTRYYSDYTAKKKQEYITSHIQNRLSCTLQSKNSESDYCPWDNSKWEEFLFDDLAYFSEAFDSFHKYRKLFKKTHQELWPDSSPINKT